MTSWKTTAGGILALLGGVVTIGNMVVGGAPLDVNTLSLAITGIGAGFAGLMAKDHNVSNSPTPVQAKEVVGK
jgi:hypothetical protein